MRIFKYFNDNKMSIDRSSVQPFYSATLSDMDFKRKDTVKPWNIQRMEESYSLLTQAFPKMNNIHAASFFTPREEKAQIVSLPENALILVVLANDDNPHVIMGINKRGCFITIDSDDGSQRQYAGGFSEFLQKVEKFTGIFFRISQESPAKVLGLGS